MASYKAVLNPFTGEMTLIRADSAFHLKDSVDTYNDLPLTGNTENDVRITEDTDKMYTWGISTSSGELTDWKEIGSSASVDWSAITNKPSSSTTNIDDAVTKRHTQGTDQKLDEGGVNEVSASTITGHITNTSNPHSVDKSDVGLGSVDNKSEATIITDVKADSDVADAISKKHSHSNKTELDKVTDGDHDVRTDNPHSVTKTQVGLGNVPNLDSTSAINSSHTQNTDTSIVLTSALSFDTTASGIKTTFTAGENLSFGKIGYMKSDGKIWKADADTIATAFVIVMALDAISADSSGSFLILGIARNDAWDWTIGGEIYLSTDAGELTQVAPTGTDNAVIIVGIALTADIMLFRPSSTIIELT